MYAILTVPHDGGLFSSDSVWIRCYCTDTNDAGDGHRDVMALVLLSHGDLEAKTFPAIPHMPHEMAWFNVTDGTSAAL